MKNSGKWSLLIAIICLIAFGLIRFTDINEITLLVSVVVLSIIGMVLGFLSKNALLTSVNFVILLISIFILFVFLMLYSRAYYS